MKIRVLYSGDADWVGLYADGQLLMEGHNLNTGDVIRALLPDADFKVVHDNVEQNLDRFGWQCPPTWPDELEA